MKAHSFFEGFSTGLVPLIREVIVPYLVALSLHSSTGVQHSYVTFLYIDIKRLAIPAYFVFGRLTLLEVGRLVGRQKQKTKQTKRKQVAYM